MSSRSPKADSSLASLGKVIKALRAEAGMTQARLAERSSLHPTYICHVERGAANLSWTVLGRICRGLGVQRSGLVKRVESLEGRQ